MIDQDRVSLRARDALAQALGQEMMGKIEARATADELAQALAAEKGRVQALLEQVEKLTPREAEAAPAAKPASRRPAPR